MRSSLVVGNWKMNGSRTANAALLAGIRAGCGDAGALAVCAPFPYLAEVAAALDGSPVAWGAQDVSVHAAGAYTGEVSAPMLAEFACRYVLVGHSERRQMHGETDAVVAQKARAARAAGITPIACVGETLAERDAGATCSVVARQTGALIDALGGQMAQVVVAYEPVWAIGTGRTASPAEAQAVHAALRAQLAAAGAGDVPLLYGGSVKAANAAGLFAQPDVDGALVGGASLDAQEFLAIGRAAWAARSATMKVLS
ncbi:MAG: triose-phosphate isomerase [Proteobacteria bacterium]|nr:triose-phosphate isomerase [Pseudomonadota bacterium]